MPATTTSGRTTSTAPSQPASPGTPQRATMAFVESGVPWWTTHWDMHQAWLLSYWQAWQTVAWVPWNMVVSAWQIADVHAADKEPHRGVLHSALGEIDLDKAK